MQYRIREISERIEAPASTVRYWQNEFAEFVKPVKTNGGQCRYSEEDLQTFCRIKDLLYEKKESIQQAKILLREERTKDGNIHWENRTILVTGGTGSFGKHFCKVMLTKFQPKTIRVFSRDELKQHEMRLEFDDDKRLRFLIGDVRDGDRLRRAMEGADLVVHAAALKQVPACEYNPFEAVKTNIHGAQNVIEAAIDAGIRKVVALSTDKAVNPVNLYGATKLCSDKLFIQGNAYAGGRRTRFACVRYGNVIGSRGSVIPVFMQQKSTGKITVTDKRMTRFWITLDQAVDLVIKAFQHMQGGEIFVPKIPSMRIVDLAQAVAPECAVDYIGIRPGEKLHEALTGEDESRHTVLYKGFYVIMPSHSWWQRENYVEAERMPENFVYTSDRNEQWLSVEDLRGIVFGPETVRQEPVPRLVYAREA